VTPVPLIWQPFIFHPIKTGLLRRPSAPTRTTVFEVIQKSICTRAHTIFGAGDCTTLTHFRPATPVTGIRFTMGNTVRSTLYKRDYRNISNTEISSSYDWQYCCYLATLLLPGHTVVSRSGNDMLRVRFSCSPSVPSKHYVRTAALQSNAEHNYN
jgi:hypothetical protein